MAKRLRIIFFGLGGYYSTIPLRAILSEHDIAAIYSDTKPASKSKRPGMAAILKRKFQASARSFSRRLIKDYEPVTLEQIAEEYEIPYHKVRTVNTPKVADEIGRYEPDLICIASFNRILKPRILRIPRIGVINSHSALLPDFRGPNTFFWMVKTQAKTGGCTLHWAVEKPDAGSIIAQKQISLYNGMTSREYSDALAFPVADLYLNVLRECANGKPPTGRPNENPTTPYCRNPKPEDLDMDLTYTTTHALWFHLVGSEYGIPYVKLGVERIYCRQLLRKHVRGSVKIDFSNGSLWAFQ